MEFNSWEGQGPRGPPPYGGSGGGGGRGRGGWGRGRGRGRGRGGWGRPNRDDDTPAAREAAWLSRFRRIILNLGEPEDFHAASEMYAVAQELVDGVHQAPDGTGETITKAFLASVTEQPHKHPLLIALLATLSYTPPTPRTRDAYPALDVEGKPGEPPPADTIACELVEQVVQGMLRAFRSFLDQRLWRSVRLQVRFLALLAGVGLVQRASVLSLLNAFAAVLDEPAVTAARGDWASEVIIEAVLFAGPDLALTPISPLSSAAVQVKGEGKGEGDAHGDTPTTPTDGPGAADLDALVEAVTKYSQARKVSDDLVSPITPGADIPHLLVEAFPEKIRALEGFQAQRYPHLSFLPLIRDLVPPGTADALPVSLPTEFNEQVAQVSETLIPPDNEEQEGATTLPEDPIEDPRADPMGADRVRANPDARAEQVCRSGKGPHGTKVVLLRWMGATTPQPGSMASVVLRSLVNDLVDLYEPNRREAARVLVNLPHWLPKSLFGGRTDPEIGMSADFVPWETLPDTLARTTIWGLLPEAPVGEPSPWILEDLIIESLLSMAMVLPRPPYPVLYYATLLREVVSLAPGTVAPAIGKTLRRLFAALGTGDVEPELVLRTITWFSVHLSNFNYGWAWGEWVPAMEAEEGEPRRTLVINLVREIIRLAYYDRIRGVLPPALVETAMPEQEPGPVFDYAPEAEGGDPQLAHLVRPAQKVLGALRTKLPSNDVRSLLDRLKRSLLSSATGLDEQDEELEEEFKVPYTDETTGATVLRPIGGVESEREAVEIVSEIAMESLLLLGSRSFSHLLNIVERYHVLLRGLSETEPMRVTMLAAALRFWRENDEWGTIVVDKLLQYRIVEPNDVLTLVFSQPRSWARPLWGLLANMAVEKASARVSQLRTRETGTEEDETKRSMALSSVETEHRRVLVAVVQGLAAGLDDAPTEGDWARYWQLGWYKQILRVFHPELQAHAQTVGAVFASSPDGLAKKLLEQACFLGTE